MEGLRKSWRFVKIREGTTSQRTEWCVGDLLAKGFAMIFLLCLCVIMRMVRQVDGFFLKRGFRMYVCGHGRQLSEFFAKRHQFVLHPEAIQSSTKTVWFDRGSVCSEFGGSPLRCHGEALHPQGVTFDILVGMRPCYRAPFRASEAFLTCGVTHNQHIE